MSDQHNTKSEDYDGLTMPFDIYLAQDEDSPSARGNHVAAQSVSSSPSSATYTPSSLQQAFGTPSMFYSSDAFSNFEASGSTNDAGPSRITNRGNQPATPLSNDYPISFQLPSFMQSGPPILTPGGGAEVLSAGMLLGETGREWFIRNGFEAPDSLRQNVTSSEQSRSNSVQRTYPRHEYQDDYSSPSGQMQPPPTPTSTIKPPFADEGPPLDLPLYSASGFDLLSVLAKVATRSNPTVKLGPVDMSSSFLVVDVRRHDHPIIYCSPNFSILTGYSEREVLGRNCRFLQAPDGRVQKGDYRHYTSNEAVNTLKKATAANKECQVTLMNFRKDGGAFMNLVTVVPIFEGNETSDEAEAIYHVGFQVDLSEQPTAILERLRDGSYLANYNTALTLPTMNRINDNFHATSRAIKAFPSMGKEMQTILDDTALAGPSSISTEDRDTSHVLSSILLSQLPDFVHVVSLKGTFLYVAPGISRILGYRPEELVGESLAKFCHPADVVPVMRELKDSSSTESVAGHDKPRMVDLLFRAQVKGSGGIPGRFIWLECRGRLHVEPGKGRKAIMLSARAREMNAPFAFPSPGLSDEGEWWGSVERRGRILSMNTNGLLGWAEKDMTGKLLTSYVTDEDSRRELQDMLLRSNGQSLREMKCRLRSPDAGDVDVQLRIWTSPPPSDHGDHHIAPAPIIYQVRRSSLQSSPPTSGPNVYQEIDTTRNTSWQYELQQVRYENQRLTDQVKTLEHELGLSPSTSAPPSSQQAYQEPSLASPLTATSQTSPWTSTWGTSTSNKRSWDTMGDDGGGG